MAQRAGQGGVLAPFESPYFRVFFLGQSISVLGTWLQIVAEGWLVFRLTHSPVWLGIVAGAGALPCLLLTLWGGEIADRCSRRRILMLTSASGMVLALLLALLASGRWVSIEPWHVVMVAAGAGITNAFSGPAFQAFLPELVPKRDLGRAIAFHALLWNSARIVGPLVGAALIARHGVAVCFLLNGLSYLAVLAALSRVQLASPAIQAARRPCPWEGLRHIRSEPAAARAVVLLAVTVCFGWCFQTLLPALAEERFCLGATGVGAFMAAVGIGATLAGLLTAVFNGEEQRRQLVYGGALVYSAALFALATVPLLPCALAAAAVGGFGLVVCGIRINALLQASAPDRLRGRVMGVFSLMFTVLQPLGGLLAGFAAQMLGSATTVGIAAGICLIATAVLYGLGAEPREAPARRELEVVLEAA